MAALNMVVGHELFHRKERIHRFMGWIPYVKTYYSQFYTAHIKFHHKMVATKDDPTTSRKGESVYSFFGRTLSGCYLEVWALNPTYSSELVWQFILHLLIITSITFIFGIRAAFLSLLQAFVAIFMLETVNYIEHYGLERLKEENGEYEPVNIRHSWNAP